VTAIRGARSAEGRYVQLMNAAGQDERLSLEARGIIYLVLSLPQDHTFTRKWLVDRVSGRNGRRTVDNALSQLEQYGYFVREPHSAGRGKWDWEQVISDDPAELSDYRNRSPETTSGNIASSQVSSVDRFSQDDNRQTKRETRDNQNTVNTARRAPRGRAGGDAPAGAQTPRRYARTRKGEAG
jgi:hypothetical protein